MAFPELIASINAANVDLAVHVGDIKNGSTRCDTSYFQQIFDDFAELNTPLVYTPGDSVVPKSSLEASRLRLKGYETVLPIASELYQCETHGKLITNPDMQQKLFGLLGAVTDTVNKAVAQP